ncbi:MAG: hypothetical protein NC102_06900 [Clostridium sp.]|nr:hypothetical protein [Clostridium sp.]
MTQPERDKIIEKMLTKPSALSDAEIERILADDELCQLYDAAMQAKAAISLKDYDADAEWAAFVPKLKKKPRFAFAGWSAAAAVAALLIAGISFLKTSDNKESTMTLIAKTDTLYINQGVTEAEIKDSVEPELLAQAEAKLPEAPKISNKKKTTSPPNIPTPPLNNPTLQQPAEIDLQEAYIIEQARIENELATLRAQAYIAQSYAEFYSNPKYILDDELTLSDKLTFLTAQ